MRRPHNSLWKSHTSAISPEAERNLQSHYDGQGREILVKEYDSQGQVTSTIRFIWGDLGQAKTKKADTKGVSLWRRWVWKMIERFLVQRNFQRSLWQKVFSTLFVPDYLIRSEVLDAEKELQKYSIYVYQPDGTAIGVDQYSGDGRFLGFLPIE